MYQVQVERYIPRFNPALEQQENLKEKVRKTFMDIERMEKPVSICVQTPVDAPSVFTKHKFCIKNKKLHILLVNLFVSNSICRR